MRKKILVVGIIIIMITLAIIIYINNQARELAEKKVVSTEIDYEIPDIEFTIVDKAEYLASLNVIKFDSELKKKLESTTYLDKEMRKELFVCFHGALAVGSDIDEFMFFIEEMDMEDIISIDLFDMLFEVASGQIRMKDVNIDNIEKTTFINRMTYRELVEYLYKFLKESPKEFVLELCEKNLLSVENAHYVSIETFKDDKDEYYTNAIIKANNYLENIGGGVLLFSEGDYLVKPSEIFIPSNIKWLGDGKARIFSREEIGYNILISTESLSKNIIIKNIIFDQMEDKPILPDVNKFEGCFLLYAYNTENIQVEGCSFYSYGVCALLTQSFETSPSEIMEIKNNNAYFQRRINKYYDVSIFNIDARQVIATNNYTESIYNKDIKSWKARTGFEIHAPIATISENQSINTEVGIIHLNWPTLWETVDEITKSLVVIVDNSISGCIVGISVWGNSSNMIANTENLVISNNSINMRLENNYVPAYGISLENGDTGYGEFGNVEISNNTIEMIVDASISKPSNMYDKQIPGKNVGAVLINTNNRVDEVNITKNTVINFPFNFVNIELQDDRNQKHGKVSITNNSIINSGYGKSHDSKYESLINVNNIRELTINDNMIRFEKDPMFPVINFGERLDHVTMYNNSFETLSEPVIIKYSNYQDFSRYVIDFEYKRNGDSSIIVSK